MSDKRSIEILGNDGKYYLLKYTHKELEDLLDKIATGCVLTVSDYDKLMDLQVENLSTFSGYYDDLLDKPNFDLLESRVDALCNCTGNSLLQQRVDKVQNDVANLDAKIIEEIRKVTQQQFELQGDFINKSELLKIQAQMDDLSDQINSLRNEIARIESLCYNKSNIGHTHNVSEFKLGGKSLDAVLALKAGIDHTHADFEYHIDDVDDACAALEARFFDFKDIVERDYQTKEDPNINSALKTVVEAINELYDLYSTLANK